MTSRLLKAFRRKLREKPQRFKCHWLASSQSRTPFGREAAVEGKQSSAKTGQEEWCGLWNALRRKGNVVELPVRFLKNEAELSEIIMEINDLRKLACALDRPERDGRQFCHRVFRR